MKKLTLQLENIEGVIEQESQISMGDNDILVMQYPERMTLAEAYESFEILENSFINNVSVIAMPSDLTFKVIKNKRSEKDD